MTPPVVGGGVVASVPEHARPLVGRDTELAGLIRLLREPGVRLVTLTGPPGVGKTSLALAAVEAFPEGVAVVDLAPVRDPDLVPAAIAGATGTDAADVDSLARSLAGHDVLLVLDNLEHLLPAAAVVTGLLATCPRLKVLAEVPGQVGTCAFHWRACTIAQEVSRIRQGPSG